MLIEFDKYQPNSLRKGRVEAIEKDLGDAFTIFSNRFSNPHLVTMNDFLAFWNQSQLKFLIFLRNQEEDEDQYFHVIDKILISDYFLKGNDYKKIFCLLSMYFFAYSIDMNGDRNSRFIHVNPQFIKSLKEFLQANRAYAKQLFFKVVKKIKDLFIYGIKLGVREPLIKKNGETFVRYPRPQKKTQKGKCSPTVLQIKQEHLPALQDIIKNYQQSKQKLFKDYKDQKMNSYKKQMGFDKNITLRMQQILKSYESQVSQMQQEMKMVPQEPIEQ